MPKNMKLESENNEKPHIWIFFINFRFSCKTSKPTKTSKKVIYFTKQFCSKNLIHFMNSTL